MQKLPLVMVKKSQILRKVLKKIWRKADVIILKEELDEREFKYYRHGVKILEYINKQMVWEKDSKWFRKNNRWFRKERAVKKVIPHKAYFNFFLSKLLN